MAQSELRICTSLIGNNTGGSNINHCSRSCLQWLKKTKKDHREHCFTLEKVLTSCIMNINYVSWYR
jgi:hypothetical protein